MEEVKQIHRKIVCNNCGQTVGFKVDKIWRKTQLVKCPVCKKRAWAILDSAENCMARLAAYEQLGMKPVQIVSMKFLYNSVKQIADIGKVLDKLEQEYNLMMSGGRADENTVAKKKD